MNRAMTWILSGLLAVFLTACGEQNKPAPAQPAEATPQQVEQKVEDAQKKAEESTEQAVEKSEGTESNADAEKAAE